MTYQMFDVEKAKFVGKSNRKKHSNHIAYIPEVDFIENNSTFLQFFNKFQKAIKEENLKEIDSCHRNYPKFMDIWADALIELF